MSPTCLGVKFPPKFLVLEVLECSVTSPETLKLMSCNYLKRKQTGISESLESSTKV